MDRWMRVLGLAALLGATLAVSACTPDTPETQLSWGVDDHLDAPRHQAPPQVARTYIYDDAVTTAPPVPTPRPSHAEPPRMAQAYLPPPRDEGGDVAFVWPASGNVVAGFGSSIGGERNDGINISTRMDAPIRASASGTVSYAGDELKGYGNLVLIKHDGGYVTAYAHADRFIVARGDAVTKGQVIGYVGQSGDVTSPQLHFEIRRNTTPVDPRALLTARAGA